MCFQKCIELRSRSVSNDGHVKAECIQCGRFVGIVSDLLTAEHSAEVTDKNKDGAAFGPKAIQFVWGAGSVKNIDRGNGVGHE